MLSNKELNEQLLDAIKDGKIEQIQSLLDQGADVNAKNNDGWTVLHCAAGHNHTEIARLLLEKGANISDREHRGQTPLHHATRNNCIKVIQLLLDKGANVNDKDFFCNTSLQHAVRGSHAKIICLLLIHGGTLHDDERIVDDRVNLKKCLKAFEETKAMPHLGKLIEANIKKEGAKTIASYINNKAEGQELIEEFETIKRNYGSNWLLSFIHECLLDFVKHTILNHIINHQETNAIRAMAHLAKNPTKNKVDVPEEMFENIASYLDSQSLKNLHLAYHMSTDEDYGRAMNLLKRMKATESVLDQPGAVGLEDLFLER